MSSPSWWAARWLTLYAALVLLPLGIALVNPRPSQRELAVEFGVSLGFIAFALLGLQFVLTARFPKLAAPFGLDALLHFHRVVGLLAFAAVLAHVVLLILARRDFLQFLNPFDGFSNFIRAAALWTALSALTLLVVLTLRRRQLRVPYQWWRISHGLLALIVLAIAVIHIARVQHYSAELWKLALWAGLAALAAALLGWTRVVRPIRQLRRPYEVVEVRHEVDRVWTMILEPRGHAGMQFQGGQFAWLILAQEPWHVDAHPFSFSSSSAVTGRVEFTIKELGDFTAGIGDVQSGVVAYLDGPYGNFVLSERDAGAVFVVGGVGVTPALSILRSMRDGGDSRPVWLVYGADTIDSVIRRDELAELSSDGRVRTTLVIGDPPADWEGERGGVTREILERALPSPVTPGLRYFVCGPEGRMETVESALRDIGVPKAAIRSERFNIA